MKKLLLILTIILLCNINIYSQEEKLEVDGAIQIANSEDPTPDPGTIRWNGSDFEGWNGVIWVSLTGKVVVGSVTDIEGNSYKTITIGTQEWMTENLRVSQYQDGSPVEQVTSNAAWEGLNSGAWCWYDNQDSYDIPYGKLYNWYAVDDSRGLCPAGWHVPADMEWITLKEYLGGESVAGGKMKESGLEHWNDPNRRATNESGWSALPGGLRRTDGSFSDIGFNGYWWSDAAVDTTNAWYRFLSYYYGYVLRFSSDKGFGFSVRCLKD